ncbi:AAA domain-containing protein [Cerioporus squamosus]|nr:AAA domain-containing protein [Cerioporus squamosus]
MPEDLAATAHRGDALGKYNAIFVLGPSSSGKTTLCNALARKLDVPVAQYIKEVARTVMKTHNFTRNDTGTYEMQHAIMCAQLKAEAEALKLLSSKQNRGCSHLSILSDRSAVDPIVYAGTSTVDGAEEGRRKLLDDDSFKAVLPFYRQSLFVVLEPVAEWLVDDGVRSLEDPWRYNGVLYKTLADLAIPYITLGATVKDVAERVDYVVRYLTGVRQGMV